MIHLYDGNNIMYRQYETKGTHKAMSVRMRYEHACAQPPGTQIWCWDGHGHNERRQEVYPQYKAKRPPKPEDLFAQVKLFREALKHSTAIQIEVLGWEADDVIGTLVRRFAAQGVATTVHTNDMDYGQIAHLCTLNGVNMKGVSPHRVTLYKALVGDTSDNIDGIPGFGHGRWLEMENHWDDILKAIVTGTPEAFVDLPFKPAVKAWLASHENIATLQAMLTVTHFDNVPDDELEGGIHHGVLNRPAAHALLGKFFL